MINPEPFVSMKKTVASCYGKLAVSFSRADYMLGGFENEEHFGPFQILFSDGSVLQMEDNGDAESISCSNDPIIFGNSEDYIHWKEISLNGKSNFSDFINRKLIQARFLKNSFQDREWIGGCQLIFESGKSMTYINHYDDAKLEFGESALLSSFIIHERSKWIEI